MPAASIGASFPCVSAPVTQLSSPVLPCHVQSVCRPWGGAIGPPATTSQPWSRAAGPPAAAVVHPDTLDALRQQYGSADDGDDPGHHPRSPTTAGAPTPHASSFPPPPPAPAKHDEITMIAMIEHMQQQLADLLLTQRVTNATPAPLPHPTTLRQQYTLHRPPPTTARALRHRSALRPRPPPRAAAAAPARALSCPPAFAPCRAR
jgi:hypothetical protein